VPGQCRSARSAAARRVDLDRPATTALLFVCLFVIGCDSIRNNSIIRRTKRTRKKNLEKVFENCGPKHQRLHFDCEQMFRESSIAIHPYLHVVLARRSDTVARASESTCTHTHTHTHTAQRKHRRCRQHPSSSFIIIIIHSSSYREPSSPS
jgi:hypothetical protein